MVCRSRPLDAAIRRWSSCASELAQSDHRMARPREDSSAGNGIGQDFCALGTFRTCQQTKLQRTFAFPSVAPSPPRGAKAEVTMERNGYGIVVAALCCVLRVVCVCVCARCVVCVVSVVFVLCAMYVRCVRLCACVRSCVCVCAHVFVWVLVYVWRCLCASVADATPYNIDRHVCVCVRACVWVAQLYANDQFCMLSLACPWSAAATMLQAYMATKLVAPTEPGLVARACCAHGCDHLTQHRSSTSSSLGLVAPTGETV